MKFTIDKRDFKNALELAKLTAVKNSLPSIRSCKFEVKENYLIISGTDLNSSIVQKIRCNNDNIDFMFLLEISNFKNIISYLSKIKDIDISVELNEAGFIQIKDLKISVFKTPILDYPIIKQAELDKSMFSMRLIDFQELFKKHIAFIDNTKSNYQENLKGVYVKFNINNMETVSTDGHALLLQKNQEVLFKKDIIAFIIPVSMLTIANKIKTYGIIRVYKTDDIISFVFCVWGGDSENGQIIISGKEPAGKYPDYTAVIPISEKQYKQAKINRHEFLDNIEIAALMTSDQSGKKGITINFDGYIDFKDTNKKMEYAGNDTFNELEIKLSSDYLKESLKTITDDVINITLNTELKYTAIMLSNSDNSKMAILMPMRY